MLANHNQLSGQYPGLVRTHSGVFNRQESQALNLSTSQQQHYHHQQQQQHSLQQQHSHAQLQQQRSQLQDTPQPNYSMGVSVQDLHSRPVQRVSPAIQPTEDMMSPCESLCESPVPSDLLLKSTTPQKQGNNIRRNSGDIATIEVPLSRYSSVIASAVPTVTADGNALQIKRKDFIASRKRREFIPEQAKDNTYWDKRKKNNEAAKRSREKRRYNDIVVEAHAFELTQENTMLKEKLNALAERFGIIDIESLSVDELKNGPLVKVKQEMPSSPPPAHEELETVNDCVRVEQQTPSREQFQPQQFCQRQIVKQVNSVTKERAVQERPNSHVHQPSTQCKAKTSQIPVGPSAPVAIHVPNQYHVNAPQPTSRYMPSGMALSMENTAPACKSTSQQSPAINRDHTDSIAKLYGIEHRRVSAPSVATCENTASLLPKNYSKSTPSLNICAEESNLYSVNSRERKTSQCSEDFTCGAKSPPHSAFNETSHKLPHKLRGKTRHNAATPDGIPRESSPVPSSPIAAELSPRALVIDVSYNQTNDSARDISGMCTPPSSADSLPSSPVSTSSSEEPIKHCKQMPQKAPVEPYRKMVLAAQKLAMVSSDTDSTPKSMNNVYYPEEEYQPWAKKRLTNDQTVQYVNGLPDSQRQLMTSQAPSPTYLQFENSQLRNELKMLSQDVASLKNLIQTKQSLE